MSIKYKTIEEILALCETEIAVLGLDMTVTGAEYSSDNTVLTIRYTASGRIDLLPLLRRLASEPGVRIEMKQIKAE